MKIFFYIFFSIICVACLAQDAKEIDRGINENKGTFVIRQLKKNNDLHNDSAKLVIRFLSGFCRLIKSDSPNSTTFFKIDNQEYMAGTDGSLSITLKCGVHFISIIRRPNSLYYANFSPIRELKLNFKSKRNYEIDIYLPLPFLNEH
jgi:hypothetical protein